MNKYFDLGDHTHTERSSELKTWPIDYNDSSSNSNKKSPNGYKFKMTERKKKTQYKIKSATEEEDKKRTNIVRLLSLPLNSTMTWHGR